MIKGFLAGLMIAFCGYANVVIENKYIGAFLFAFGLLTIISKEYELYTGKVYLLSIKSKESWIKIISMLFFNVIGASFLGLIVRFCTKETTELLWQTKFEKSLFEVIVASIFCGILMYLAVTLYQKEKIPLYVIMPIMLFILSGCEHCIANVFYLSIAPQITTSHIIYLIINIIGNSLGSLVFFNLDKKSKIGG